MIAFNSIPASFRTPGQHIEFDASRAVSGLPPIDNRVLLIGQKLDSGDAEALSIEPVASAAQAIALFGRGSQLARIAAAYVKADSFSQVHAIGLPDADGASKASGTIAVSGPAIKAGTIALMIAGTRIGMAIAAGMPAAAIAAMIAERVNDVPDLPVVAVADAGDVTLTARNGGDQGNALDLRHSHYPGEGLPSGVDLAITAMAGGAGDPDIAAVFPVLGDEPYRTIVVPQMDTAAYAAIKAELDDRWSAARMLESVAYTAISGTQGALAAFGAGLNSELISVLGIGDSPTPPGECAAIYAAACGYHSAIDPARPLHTLALTGMVAPRQSDRFTRASREVLLKDGIATYTVDQAGGCHIERAITTYQTDAFGLDDIAFLDLETVTTLAFLRASVRQRIAAKYPRHKLANDGTRYGAGQAMVTPNVIRAELIALAREWEDAGLVEGLDQYVADLIVERDAGDPNRINALIPPDIVNQFRSFAAAIQFRL